MNEQGHLPDGPPDVVLDTNTVLDLVLFADPPAQPLRAAIEAGRLRWLATPRMGEELAGVLSRPQMGRWAPRSEAERVLAWMARWAVACDPPPPGCGPRCRDPADQPFIDLAWAMATKWLLTRDKALLKLARAARPRGVVVCTPARWSMPPAID